jgi:hypothetical protein
MMLGHSFVGYCGVNGSAKAIGNAIPHDVYHGRRWEIESPGEQLGQQ